jgi:hypothetical protein
LPGEFCQIAFCSYFVEQNAILAAQFEASVKCQSSGTPSNGGGDDTVADHVEIYLATHGASEFLFPIQS